MMYVQFKTSLALLFVASVPLTLSAAAQNPTSGALTAKEVRQAEASAKTASDHAQLAVYYQSKAQQTQSKLAYEEDLMRRFSWMAGSTKIPNPYWSARTQADNYRAELEKVTKLAADHQKTAESLQASAQPAQ